MSFLFADEVCFIFRLFWKPANIVKIYDWSPCQGWPRIWWQKANLFFAICSRSSAKWKLRIYSRYSGRQQTYTRPSMAIQLRLFKKWRFERASSQLESHLYGNYSFRWYLDKHFSLFAGKIKLCQTKPYLKMSPLPPNINVCSRSKSCLSGPTLVALLLLSKNLINFLNDDSW